MAHQSACGVESGVQGTRAASLGPIEAQVVEAGCEWQRQQAKRRRIEAERREGRNEEDEGGRLIALAVDGHGEGTTRGERRHGGSRDEAGGV